MEITESTALKLIDALNGFTESATRLAETFHFGVRIEEHSQAIIEDLTSELRAFNDNKEK